MILRAELLKYLNRKELTLADIRANPSINPLPVGRQNLEKLVREGQISDRLQLKLFKFLMLDE